MKKAALFLTLLLTFSLPVSASDLSKTVEPKASYVFRSETASINASAYGGSCSLTDYGSGTMTITLQKQLTSNKAWMPVDGATGTKSFSSKITYGFSKSKILSAGTYRSKVYVKATVGSHTDSRTVYSPSLVVSSN